MTMRNKCSLLVAAALSATAALAADDAGGMSVGWATAAEKIRPRTAAAMRPVPADGLRVRLARNEYESVQVLVTPREDGLKGVKVGVAGDLRGDAGVFAATRAFLPRRTSRAR